MSGVGRLRIRVRGLVQGVGFRPHAFRLAERFAVAGFVLNDSDGVLIEAEGDALDAFLAALEAQAPPLARIDSVESVEIAATGAAGFEIRDSDPGAATTTAIGPDIAMCEDCRAEMFDPADRRHRYAFATCTHCGPRFTVTARLPYDRATTSLAPFPLCETCEREYRDPRDRRFHAETTCCPACGPRLAVPVGQIAQAIAQGRIVALKGIGGFHLVCDATREDVVAELRRRKRRDGKPFAVMVPTLDAARRLAELDAIAERLLVSRERPVVVARLRGEAGLAPSVSNGLPTVGLFLPYAPVHHLLFAALPDAGLVATSANLSGEPLVIDDAEARERLDGIADLVAGHDRAILVRADDSVMRVVDGAPAFIRRARGFTPLAIPLASEMPCVLALGAHLKATVTVTRGGEAFVSQHVGDLDTPAAQDFLAATARHLEGILEVAPLAVAHDLHPDFASTRLAASLGLPAIAVQHHVAHVAALAAEHRHEGPLLGLALDGFGLGTDGGAWGGELLLLDGLRWARLGHLAPLAEPGGDVAAREPWRMAAAALHALGRGDEIETRFAAERHAAGVRQLLDRGINAAPTSSAGRLFDACAGLLGVSVRQAFEGEAAMRLEGLADSPQILEKTWAIRPDGSLDVVPLLGALADMTDAVAGANFFHGSLAAALARWVARAAQATGVSTVALGGGCFLNAVLTQRLVEALRAEGLTPLLARAVPPNDGGVSLGQALLAARVVDAGVPLEQVPGDTPGREVFACATRSPSAWRS